MRIEERILLVTPSGREAKLAQQAFESRGLDVEVCKDIFELCDEIRVGAGAAVVADESLTKQAESQLVQAMRDQPIWSSFPLIILTSQEEGDERWRILKSFGRQTTTLKRPVQVENLLNAVELAVKARQRQVDIREDIREREKTSLDLQASEERLKIALEAGRLGAWEWEIKEQKITRILHSELLQKFTGLKGTTTFKEFKQSIHPDFRETVAYAAERAVSRATLYHVEYKLQRGESEETVWIEAWGKPFIRKGELMSILGVAADVTRRKRTEEELVAYKDHLEELVQERTRELEESHKRLRLSERMASIGTLSAGLGHDMGNLLLPVRVRLEAIARKNLSDDLREDITVIARSTQYLQRLASGLRLFALDPEETTHLDASTSFDSWWEEVEPFFKNVISKRISLEVEYDKNLPDIKLARHRLTQAIFNLVQNAGDALKKNESDGKIKIIASAEHDAEHDCVVVTVTDNGPGMDDEIVERCFEPFYTTKTRGISTGLGLSLVNSIVNSAGGAIEIDSLPGEGTSVSLKLPITSSPKKGKDRGLAILSLKDGRLNSYAASLLNPLSYDVEISEKLHDPKANLWITEAAPGIEDKAENFIKEGKNRRVAIFNAKHESLFDDGIVNVPYSPKPKLLREVLKNLVVGSAMDTTGNGDERR